MDLFLAYQLKTLTISAKSSGFEYGFSMKYIHIFITWRNHITSSPPKISNFRISFSMLYKYCSVLVNYWLVKASFTTQKMKFSIKGFFSKSFLRIWSHLLKKSSIENFIFCVEFYYYTLNSFSETSCFQNFLVLLIYVTHFSITVFRLLYSH